MEKKWRNNNGGKGKAENSWRFKEHLLEAYVLLLPLDESLLVELLWRLDLWASMRSFYGDFHHGDAAEDKGEEVRGGIIH